VSRSPYHLPGEALQSVDVFVVGVYPLEDGEPPGAFAVRVPAQGLTWHDDGHSQFSEVARFPWAAVIDPAEIGTEVS